MTVFVVGLVEINVFNIKHAAVDVVSTITPSMETWGLKRVKTCAKQDLKPVACRELFTQPEMICRVNSAEWIIPSYRSGRSLESGPSR